MIPNTIAAKLKRQSKKADFKGWYYKAALIVQTIFGRTPYQRLCERIM